MIRGLFISALALFLIACGEPTSIEVTATEFGDKWPLSVSKATLRCVDRVRTLEVDGMAYALNGKALTAGLPPADARVLKNPDVPALTDLTERAGQLCQ